MASFDRFGQNDALRAMKSRFSPEIHEKISKNDDFTSSFWRVFDPFLLIRGCTFSDPIFSSDEIPIYTGQQESPKYVWYFFPSHTAGGSKLVAWMGFLDQKFQSRTEKCHPGVSESAIFDVFLAIFSDFQQKPVKN